MIPIFALVLAALVSPEPAEHPWEQIRLTVIRDPYTSSDTVTLCRVRAENFGARRWSGRDLAFEVHVPGARPAVRARGRFGLTLEPYGVLETLVALRGRHDRFEVVPLPPHAGAGSDSSIRRKGSRPRRKPARGQSS